METPRFEGYGDYSSDNYGVNALVFTDAKGNNFYFSYKTLVAFSSGGEFFIRENDWGPTTGKHLNWINPNKDLRISEESFEREYSRVFP